MTENYRIVIDSKSQKDGTSKIYCRVIIGKTKKDIFFDVRWPREFFDQEQILVKPRFRKDPDAEPTQLKINEVRNIIHRLQVNAFVNKTSLSPNEVAKAIIERSSHENFFLFVRKTANELYRTNAIAKETRSRHLSSIQRLQEFYGYPELKFSDITLPLIEKFNGWASKKGKSHNTITGYHKDIKGYLNKAVGMKLIQTNPYKDFKFRYRPGVREALDQKELSKLVKLFNSGILEHNEREILRRFLFSCLCGGIRISDTHLIRRSMIKNNTLIFSPKKGSRNYKQTLRIPMPKLAADLINGDSEVLFKTFSNKHINEQLKIIAIKAGINKKLSFHSARDTFGTLYVEMGGDLKTLMEMMGITSLKVVEIYLKMSQTRKQELMNNFDRFSHAPEAANSLTS